MTSLDLYFADCLDVMRSMPDASVHLIATDPPYFKVKGEPWDRQWKDAAKFLAWLGEIADEWRRILAPNGSLYCFASPRLAARVEVMLGERFKVLNHLVWEKERDRGKHAAACKETLRGYFPNTERVIFAEQLGRCRYATACEELRVEVMAPLRSWMIAEVSRAGLSRKDINRAVGSSLSGGGMASHYVGDTHQWELPTAPHYEAIKRVANTKPGAPYLARDYAELRAEHEALRERFEELRRPFNVSAEVPYTDVWIYPTVSRYPGKHPCEKPYDMARDIVLASSRPGDVVFDPFMGSGVFGKAALNEGRSFIGCDMTEKYFKRASEELHALHRSTSSATATG